MTFGSNVAPRRRIREKREAWSCLCVTHPNEFTTVPKIQPGYLTRCDKCGTKRP